MPERLSVIVRQSRMENVAPAFMEFGMTFFNPGLMKSIELVSVTARAIIDVH